MEFVRICQWRSIARNWNSLFTCLLNTTFLGRTRATTSALFRLEEACSCSQTTQLHLCNDPHVTFYRESVVRKSRLSYKQYAFLLTYFSFLVQLVNWYYELWKHFAPRFLLVGMGCISYFKYLLREAEARVWSHQTFHSVTNLSLHLPGTLRNCSMKSGINLQPGAQYTFSRLMVFLLAVLSRCRAFSTAGTCYLLLPGWSDAVLS